MLTVGFVGRKGRFSCRLNLEQDKLGSVPHHFRFKIVAVKKKTIGKVMRQEELITVYRKPISRERAEQRGQ